MIIVLSPAKSLDYETPPHVKKHTLPEFVDDAAELIDGLREALAAADRQHDGHFGPARAAELPALRGLVEALRHATMPSRRCSRSTATCTKASPRSRCPRAISTTRRITCACCPGCTACCGRSICCSRIGWRWARSSRTRAASDLYAFWGERITAALNAQLKKQRGARVLINCASEEYFKSVRPKLLEAPVISPVFEDWKGGRYKIISFHAKRARGMMARYAVENRIDEPRGAARPSTAKATSSTRKASNDTTYVFRRRIAE